MTRLKENVTSLTGQLERMSAAEEDLKVLSSEKDRSLEELRQRLREQKAATEQATIQCNG